MQYNMMRLGGKALDVALGLRAIRGLFGLRRTEQHDVGTQGIQAHSYRYKCETLCSKRPSLQSGHVICSLWLAAGVLLRSFYNESKLDDIC